MMGLKNLNYKLQNSKWKGLYAGIMAGTLLIIFQALLDSLSIVLILGVLTGCLISYIINMKHIERKEAKNDNNNED